MKRKIVSGVILALLIVSFSKPEFSIKTAQVSSGTILCVDPKVIIADFGESFTVNMNIQDVTDLSSYDVKLTFDKDVLEAINIEEGPFLKEGTTSPLGTDFIGVIVNPDGYVRVMCNIIGDYPGVNESGTLFNVTFTVNPPSEANAGLSDLIFYDTNLLDSISTGITHSTLGGSFSIVHTTLRIDPSRIEDSTLTPGKTFTIDVVVSDVLFLYGWQVNMSFNPSVLRIADIIEGAFLKGQPEGTIGATRIENEKGWALFCWLTWGSYIGVSGSGNLGTVEFEVLSIGESLIRIETAGMLTILEAQTSLMPPGKFVDNPFTAENGYFSNFGTVVLPCTVDVKPKTLNLKSQGKLIKAHLELPENHDISDIDISTIRLNGVIPAALHPTEVADYDADGNSDLMVKFNRQDLLATLRAGEVTLSITGEINGMAFEGTDTIRVIGE